MSFSDTSYYYRLEGTILKAICQDNDGNEKEASLDLNTVLGNSNGVFDTQGTNFSDNAMNYGMNSFVLVSRLSDDNGNWCDAGINLNAVVKNNDGKLEKA
ncbi:Cyanovirin-N [Mycena metata]|uniref:Cyanovirin-N n=1 Tax=Mycena metata TaxID=1033252 RepID=A0AAD7GFT2_9AGAR|nr:Cyanovirin-N [Mycena metata]